ncbi:MAG: hypothetical protein LBF97_05690 [Elusimicrobiota bacterium]|nr:hypothetical protein [Elusimicrobiota bacterium]
MEQNKGKDRIAKSEHELDRQKVDIEILRNRHENEIKKANADYELSLQKIEEIYQKDLVEVENLKRKMEEKRKKSVADAEISLKRALDAIEAKY